MQIKSLRSVFVSQLLEDFRPASLHHKAGKVSATSVALLRPTPLALLVSCTCVIQGLEKENRNETHNKQISHLNYLLRFMEYIMFLEQACKIIIKSSGCHLVLNMVQTRVFINVRNCVFYAIL